jgi:hypothetical protein
MVDPWVTLAAVAVDTEQIVIGPMVTPLARRRVSVVARQSVTLDRLAGGRLRLGVGLGAPDDEFTRFGEDADPKRRALILDESLEALQLLWSGDVVTYRGNVVVIDDVEFQPTPVHGRIPDLGRRRLAGRGTVPSGGALRRRLAGRQGGRLPHRRGVRRLCRDRPEPPQRRRRTVRHVLRRSQPGRRRRGDHRQTRPPRRRRDDVVDRFARRPGNPLRAPPRPRPRRPPDLTPPRTPPCPKCALLSRTARRSRIFRGRE